MAKKKRPLPEESGLPCVGVDTHAHLDLEPFHGDVAKCLERAEQSGIAALGNVFLGSRAYRENKELFTSHPRVFFILGVHPHDADTLDPEELGSLEQALDQDKNIKAVGEIGLDYFWDRSPRERQRAAFQSQLEMARSREKPVVIHSREAEKETLDILLDMGFQDRPLVWHCFGQDKALAEQLLARGWIVSVPGIVTFAKSRSLQEAIRSIPLERMVLETDCPFLAPEPYRSKRNEPAYTVFTAKKIAEEKEVSVREVWRKTGQTARDFFHLDEGPGAEGMGENTLNVEC